MGRLVEEKGILDLYEAIKKLRSKNFKLKIVGNGPLRSKLEKMIIEDGLTHKISVMDVKYEQMPAIYKKADIFIGPSKTTKTWEEQYGMVFIEAMANSLPVVGYRSGSIPELVSKAGLLAKEGDGENLTKKIQLLIDYPNLRDKIGRIGRRRAEQLFDSRKTARKIRKIYENIWSNTDKKRRK